MPPAKRPLVLVVLDGFGLRDDRKDNAVLLANAPRLAALFSHHANTRLGASGPAVGLPEGQMGNSEVGHMNLGAGRVAQMDISRIDCAIADGSLAENQEILRAIEHAKREGGRLHLLGLLGDGGVHSSLEHLLALVDLASRHSVPVLLHVFLDGRDTPPRSATGYLKTLEAALLGKGAIATVSGRFYAMDRDNRWERVQRAYDAIVHGHASTASSAQAAVLASYAAGKDDEFVEPSVVQDYSGVCVEKDAAIFFNFRADRARELTRAMTQSSFLGFPRTLGATLPFGLFVCMTNYDPALGLPVAFAKQAYPDLFPEVLSRNGLSQLRCAETEKFAHVTFFFNGGREAPFEGEERVLIPSPRDVVTYDQKPSMSADGITKAVVSAIESHRFDFILVNYANPDMVGHTGFLNAAIAAVETVDRAVGELVDAVLASSGVLILTADHGNCELMRDPITGSPHTAHTTNPVPFVLVGEDRMLREGGRLADVAPTMLELLHLPQPEAMTGQSLLLPR